MLRRPGEGGTEAALHGDRAGFLEAEKIWVTKAESENG